ncbi:unnamed protein product [Hydatigera taeniaeformis]|uniref:Fibronectin type-III domain-containing protein n=1 Tax=Hydatigena taeniaeformis TaxID=6205 RepID=A0A0R3WYQ6_HYDTA|nr:unnamed protein product [Hydatigera taeniaeformis]
MPCIVYIFTIALLGWVGSISTDVHNHPFFELNANPCQEDPGFCFSVPTPPQDLTLDNFQKETALTGGGFPRDYIVLKLQWKPPEETYGELKGYQVSFRLVGPPELLMTTKPSEGENAKLGDGSQVTPTHAVRRNVTGTSYTSTQIDNIREFKKVNLLYLRAISWTCMHVKALH